METYLEHWQSLQLFKNIRNLENDDKIWKYLKIWKMMTTMKFETIQENDDKYEIRICRNLCENDDKDL